VESLDPFARDGDTQKTLVRMGLSPAEI